MPQVILEYSANIKRPVEAGKILGGLAAVVSAASGIEISNFKSRVLKREKFVVGDGQGGGSFVHLEVGILSGRPPDVKRRIGKDCLEYLEECFEDEAERHELQITVEIREMDKESYFKSIPGKH
jgi:5-carboxymethyl-2-hydroxymuconate isomerase